MPYVFFFSEHTRIDVPSVLFFDWEEKLSENLLHEVEISKMESFCRCIHVRSTECDVSVSKLLGLKTFPIFRWFWIRYRKNLVSKKVLDSVSEKFGIGKKFRIRLRSDFRYRHTCVHTD